MIGAGFWGLKPLHSGTVALLIVVAFSGCRPASESLVDSGRVVLRSWSGLQHGSIDIDGATIAYLEREAAGPTLVLLHGFASEKDSWLRFARKIPKHYRIVAIDLPGHGASSRDAERIYTVDAMVGLVEAAISRLTTEPAHIVGTSLGGMIATLYTARNVDAVATLSLYAPAGVYPPNPSDFQLALDRGENPLIAADAKQFKKLIDIVFYHPPPLIWPVGAALRNYSIERAPFHNKIWNDLWPEHPTLNEYLPAIDLPVLLVWGKNDRVLDVSSVEVFEKLLPQVQTITVDNLGHATVNEKPKEMARLQLNFLQSWGQTPLSN